jgi:glycosyltransferase involved in cell wall biosynthesis
MYVGRLGPEKNLTFLLRSFHGVAQAFSNVKLLIIGTGSERENLQAMVSQMGLESRVRFTGLVPYELLPTYMTLGDAFVTASITEVHPLSVIEAMASGLPVLGIQSPGVGDIVEDGITGYLVSGEDLAAFTAKMILLTTDHEKRRKMAEHARQAAQRYDIERTTQLTVECYQRAIDTVSKKRRGWPMRLLTGGRKP